MKAYTKPEIEFALLKGHNIIATSSSLGIYDEDTNIQYSHRRKPLDEEDED